MNCVLERVVERWRGFINEYHAPILQRGERVVARELDDWIRFASLLHKELGQNSQTADRKSKKCVFVKSVAMVLEFEVNQSH